MSEIPRLPFPGLMQWFGKSWDAPLNEDCPQAQVPVGAICIWCEEAVAAEDSGVIYSNGPTAHWECFMRQVVGSIAHQQKLCACFGKQGTEWPGELTKREAAKAAVDYAIEHDPWIRRPGSGNR